MASDQIKHVVVLALENHSFDQMLGCFKAVYPELEGVNLQTPHANTDDKGVVYRQKEMRERQIPDDPHHEVKEVAEQLANNNGGFVRNFVKWYPNATVEEREFIMGYYSLDFLPALHPLARNFTICDHWFSSLPGPTWPNRFMALTGTAKGRTNMPDDGTNKSDLPGYFQQDQDTIFDRLTEKGINWKSYFHDIPQSWVLEHQRLPHNAARYFYFDEFFDDARGREDDFPQFCFIEPDFMGIVGNDDHPPHDVMKAQKLIADVYNAVRANSTLWASTLLVVFYDEHGGFYDHVVPPDAVAPDDNHSEYAFNQFGLRVPALLISPWVGQRVESTHFDHTSLLKYITEKWDLRPLPSRRIESANSIAIALTQKQRTDDLLRIELTTDELTPPKLEREEDAIDHTSSHDMALKRLRDNLKAELDEAIPRWLTPMARAIAFIKERFAVLIPTDTGPGQFAGSIAEPDKLATGDASVKDDIAHLLTLQKQRAIAVLAQHISDETLTMARRRHAAETLAMISGRRFHEEDRLGEAKRLLELRAH